MKLREIEFNKRFKQYHFDNDESDCEEGKWFYFLCFQRKCGWYVK
jgi:hypothetical protein